MNNCLLLLNCFLHTQWCNYVKFKILLHGYNCYDIIRPSSITYPRQFKNKVRSPAFYLMKLRNVMFLNQIQ